MGSWCSGCSQQLHTTQYRSGTVLVLPPVVTGVLLPRGGYAQFALVQRRPDKKLATRSQSDASANFLRAVSHPSPTLRHAAVGPRDFRPPLFLLLASAVSFRRARRAHSA